MIDLTEIKKLSDEEKLSVIDEIWDSIEGETLDNDIPDVGYKEKLHQLLEERLEAYNKGESKSYTWNEVKDRLRIVKEKHTPI